MPKTEQIEKAVAHLRERYSGLSGKTADAIHMVCDFIDGKPIKEKPVVIIDTPEYRTFHTPELPKVSHPEVPAKLLSELKPKVRRKKP